MRKNYFYITFAAGLAAFSASSYAALDCSQYTNPNTAEVCKEQNETTLSAKKKDAAQLERVLSAEKMRLQKLSPGPAPPAIVAEEQAPVTGETAPQKTDIQPISPVFQYTPPPRVPNQPNQPPNATSGTGAGQGQQSGRIKYY